MPLFRFHRGSLAESLKTTVIVKDAERLFMVIAYELNIDCDWKAEMKIEPYPDNENNFDHRIGWFTHIVKANVYEENVLSPIGFLSEPIYE